MQIKSIDEAVKALKKIFLPSFCYSFELGLVDLHLSNQLKKKLSDRGANNIIHTAENGYQFSIETGDLLRKPRVGNVVVNVIDKKDDFTVTINFRSQRLVFYACFLAVALFVVFNTNYHQAKDILNSLWLVIASLLVGHIYFWSSHATDGKRIRDFFLGVGK